MNTASAPLSRFAQRAASFLVLVLIAVIMLGANPLADETIAPFDFLVQFPGWKNTGIESPVKHRKHSDILDAKLPSWRYVREKMRQGEVPVWNPHVLGGNPLLLLNTRSILTPAFAVYALFDSEAVGLYAAALVNLLVISFGSYLLFFSLTGNRLAALLGAVAFSYSGFNTSWFLWHHVNTSIWIPWVLLFAVRIAQTGDAKHVPRLAIASTMLILGGFPTVTVYGYMALLLLFVSWALFSRNHYRLVLTRGALGVAGILLSVMISMLVLYCLYESLGRLDLSYRRGSSAFKEVKDLLLYVQPFREGPLTLGRTAYVGLIPLLLFLPALWFTWRSRLDWKYVWGLSLVVVIAPLAFAWIPMDYIRQIPLIGTSMINRLHLIIGLGLSLLSVLVLSAAYQRIGKNVTTLASMVLLLLLAIQVVDQRRVFQSLVGHVKAETIYPRTATIDYVRDNIEPLQNVIADRGYLLSGVVSAYGLSEWFAHGFHTPAEKRLLKGAVTKPFLTPTASAFLCRQVNFANARLLTYLGVRYVLCSDESKYRAAVERKTVFDTIEPSPGEAGGVSLTGERIAQLFELYHQVSFDELDLALKTVNSENMPGVRLKLWMDSDPLTESAQCTLQAESDGAYLRCRFPDRVMLDKGRYEMELIVEGVNASSSLVAAVHPSDSPLLRLQTGKSSSENVLGWRGSKRINSHVYLSVLSGEVDSYTVHEVEPGVVLVENRQVRGSAYFVASLGSMTTPRYDQLKLREYSDTSMRFDYLGDKPGWVVVPVRMYPGWSCLVNGKKVEPVLFKGVMPAVPISGSGTVDFIYSPTHYGVYAAITVLGILLCLILLFKAQSINRWLAKY
ncbi:MAG: YfhO family protein [Candidatus Thiodiazotropha sp. (ex Ctena orbiculata)]|nr:YfhO family protein [Candidatus Thiodiazotropha taylori]